MSLLEERRLVERTAPEQGQGTKQRQPRRERRSDRHMTRLPRRRLAGLIALGTVAGVIGGYSLGLHAPSRTAAQRNPGVHATAECTSAVARANTTMAWAIKMGKAYVQLTQIMNQLARGQLDVDGAVRADQAPSAQGVEAVSHFNDAIAEYLRVVDSCQLENG
jgi:hypothetical protein